MKTIRNYFAKRLFKEKTGMTKVIPNKKKNKEFKDEEEIEEIDNKEIEEDV